MAIFGHGGPKDKDEPLRLRPPWRTRLSSSRLAPPCPWRLIATRLAELAPMVKTLRVTRGDPAMPAPALAAQHRLLHIVEEAVEVAIEALSLANLAGGETPELESARAAAVARLTSETLDPLGALSLAAADGAVPWASAAVIDEAQDRMARSIILRGYETRARVAWSWTAGLATALRQLVRSGGFRRR